MNKCKQGDYIRRVDKNDRSVLVVNGGNDGYIMSKEYIDMVRKVVKGQTLDGDGRYPSYFFPGGKEMGMPKKQAEILRKMNVKHIVLKDGSNLVYAGSLAKGDLNKLETMGNGNGSNMIIAKDAWENMLQKVYSVRSDENKRLEEEDERAAIESFTICDLFEPGSVAADAPSGGGGYIMGAEGFPEGWTMRTKQTAKGRSPRYQIFYYSPEQNYVFNSSE